MSREYADAEEDPEMHAANIDHLFTSIRYDKAGAEVAQKATARVAALRAKVVERKARIARLRADEGITDAELLAVLTKALGDRRGNAQTYQIRSTSAEGKAIEKTIPAGMVNNLLTEKTYIEAEEAQADRLTIVARNLLPERIYPLTYDELALLEF